MRFQGQISEWHDEQGYGFVVPNGGGDRAFVHIKAFRRGSPRPVVGDRINYVVTRDERGRPRAEQVEYPVSRTQPRDRSGGVKRWPLPVAVAFLAAVAVLAATATIPWPLFLVYAVLSLVAFGCYAVDKSAAQRGQWRIRESTLQLLALLGGWPGALAAQQLLHHKTRKSSFRLQFWIAVVINLAVMGWLLSPNGAWLLTGLRNG